MIRPLQGVRFAAVLAVLSGAPVSIAGDPPLPVVAGDLGVKLDRYLSGSGFEGVALVAKDGKGAAAECYARVRAPASRASVLPARRAAAVLRGKGLVPCRSRIFVFIPTS